MVSFNVGSQHCDNFSTLITDRRVGRNPASPLVGVEVAVDRFALLKGPQRVGRGLVGFQKRQRPFWQKSPEGIDADDALAAS